MKCEICGRPSEDKECDSCWYGMRLDPKRWIAKLKKEGIEVERGMGCVPFPGGFMCGNPYRRKLKSRRSKCRK